MPIPVAIQPPEGLHCFPEQCSPSGAFTQNLFSASGRVEVDVYFVRFGGFAAKTNETDSLSLLPQAKHARCGASNHATA
jgi:hypothetical protein